MNDIGDEMVCLKADFGELADTYTILKLKANHSVDVTEQLLSIETIIKEKSICTTDLQHVNEMMWELERMITEEEDIKKIGAFCLALRFLNDQRVGCKNKISETYGGYTEEKYY